MSSTEKFLVSIAMVVLYFLSIAVANDPNTRALIMAILGGSWGITISLLYGR